MRFRSFYQTPERTGRSKCEFWEYIYVCARCVGAIFLSRSFLNETKCSLCQVFKRLQLSASFVGLLDQRGSLAACGVKTLLVFSWLYVAWILLCLLQLTVRTFKFTFSFLLMFCYFIYFFLWWGLAIYLSCFCVFSFSPSFRSFSCRSFATLHSIVQTYQAFNRETTEPIVPAEHNITEGKSL